jgi:2-methylcitrate dehydratase PrpD
MQVTKMLAHFITETRFQNVPSEAVQEVKRAITDCIGCIFAGSVHPAGKIITDFIKNEEAKPVSVVIGQGLRTSPLLASLANGVMSHAEDFDDVNLFLLGHPSPPLVPAIFALAEQCNSSGKEIIEAYIVGFEVEVRLGKVLNPSHYDKGWHATGTLGTLGSAAACAKIMKLDTMQTQMALGIAASQTSGIRQNFGSMTKPFHAGNAAKSGVLAALLAKRGFTADKNIIEAPLGFLNVFKGEEPYDFNRAIDNLGSDFEIIKSGIDYKLYPSCYESHPGIEMAISIRERCKIDDIEKIECVFNNTMNSILLHIDPLTGLQGKFSIEYCIARALADGKVDMGDFNDSCINQNEIREIMKKITRRINSSLPLPATELNVTMKDNHSFSMRIEKPRGYTDRPLTESELESKYRKCAEKILSKDKIDHSLNVIRRLESMDNISMLADILGDYNH